MITSPAVIRGATAVLRIVPAGPLRLLAGWLGGLAYYVQPERRRTVHANLRSLLPNESSGRRRALARRTFRNLAEDSVDLFRVPSIAADELTALVSVHGLEHIDQALAAGHGAIIVTSHLGPYELGGAWCAANGYPVHAMAEVLDPRVVAALASYRGATGMKLFSTREGIRTSLKLLAANQVVLLIADRVIEDVAQRTTGMDVRFGSGIRPIPTGPAALSSATGAPIIVGHIFRSRKRRPRYVMQFEPPILPAGRSDAERRRLTGKIAESLSAAVCAHPDEWYVFQPHWRSSDSDPHRT